ncbi:MAG TPA: histidine phosphatase family protein [Tepidisphaeraceae bacterium]|nr:histidine phosphatase family protein [Tepidisphaeraceae bacterium]
MEKQWHILLLRHGLTDANTKGVIQGHRPTPLNEVGREQARRLANRLARYSPAIDILISSDLPRAAQTAEPIAKSCKKLIVFEEAWRERYFGEFEGTTAGEREIWRAAAGEIDPPGAEPAADFAARVRGALERIPSDYPYANVVAVVTHGGPCRAILHMLIDGRLRMPEGISKPELAMIANCSIMHLIYTPGEGKGLWTIARLNDVTHLGEMATLRDAG